MIFLPGVIGFDPPLEPGSYVVAHGHVRSAAGQFTLVMPGESVTVST